MNDDLKKVSFAYFEIEMARWKARVIKLVIALIVATAIIIANAIGWVMHGCGSVLAETENASVRHITDTPKSECAFHNARAVRAADVPGTVNTVVLGNKNRPGKRNAYERHT